MSRYAIHRHERGSLSVVVAWFLGIVVAAGAAFGVYVWQQHKLDDLKATVSSLRQEAEKAKNQTPSSKPAVTSDSHSYTSKNGTKIMLYAPEANATVSSPLPVIGEVPGNWSFEASFPVQLIDARGTVIAKGNAEVLGDWMTDQLVPFSVKLTYGFASSGKGSLVLQKDNPSGQPKNDDLVTIPVVLL